MANDNKIDILLSADLDATATLKSLADLRTSTAGLREEQKQLDRATAEGAVEYERLNTQIKANSKTIQQYEKEIVNSIKQEKSKEGSMKALRAELSNAKAAYAELSKEEREGAKGRALLDKTATLNAELKELEVAYGDNQRKVGEYELAGKALQNELSELTKNLYDLTAAGLQSSDSYREMFERAKELKNAQDEVNQSLQGAAKNTAGFDTMIQGAQGVTAAYGAWKSASTAVGIENESLDKTMRSLTVVMTALQSLTTLQTIAQKQSNVHRTASNFLQKIGIKQTTAESLAKKANAAAAAAESLAENASAAAKIKAAAASKLATTAQWLHNAAMSANPVMLLVVAIGVLIAGITALIGWMGRESEATRESRRAQEQLNMALEDGARIRDKIDRERSKALDERLLEGRKEIQQLRQNGATEAEILQAQARIDADVTAIRLKNSRVLVDQMEYEIERSNVALVAMEKEARTAKLSAKEYEELAAKIRETTDARDALIGNLDAENAAIGNMLQDNIERESNLQKSLKDTAKTASDAAKARVDAAISAYEKELDAQKKYREALLKAESGYQSDDLRIRQSYARKIFDLNQQTEKAKLDNLRKNNRITEDEYGESIGIMTAQLTEFLQGQDKELNKFFESERKAIMGMLTLTMEEQIAGIEKEYADAISRMEAIDPPERMGFATDEEYKKAYDEYEVFLFKQAELQIRLEDKRDKDIKDIRKSSLATRAKEIEDAISEEYETDLLMHQNNERAKLDVTEKVLQEQIAAKKAAGIETYNEEAQLENLRLRRIGLDMNKELLLAGDSAKAKYEARKKALEDELTLYADNADMQLQIARDLADNERELTQSRISAFQEWADTASDLLNSVFDLMNTRTDAELQKVQDTYDKESEALQKKHDKGLISEQEYNRQSKKLEEQRNKESARLEREKAIRERASAVFTAVTGTATAIINALNTQPFLPMGPIMAGVAAAMGSLQLATILSEPLPKAAKGGLIVGPSHNAGGTIIEAEGGEAIMSRRTVSLFGPILSALNQIGGGVPFAEPLSDGGYILRSATSTGPTAEEIAEAIKGVKIITAIEDINRGQKQYTEIEAGGSIFG